LESDRERIDGRISADGSKRRSEQLISAASIKATAWTADQTDHTDCDVAELMEESVSATFSIFFKNQNDGTIVEFEKGFVVLTPKRGG
jgi:hypothetical protein